MTMDESDVKRLVDLGLDTWGCLFAFRRIRASGFSDSEKAAGLGVLRSCLFEIHRRLDLLEAGLDNRSVCNCGSCCID